MDESVSLKLYNPRTVHIIIIIKHDVYLHVRCIEYNLFV